ncbi:MAG: hypothetical protein IT495_12235 [Gammaproteobacteria bacterium]|nr:hypothetical protein [Gammaproteobacteria bacterium]
MLMIAGTSVLMFSGNVAGNRLFSVLVGTPVTQAGQTYGYLVSFSAEDRRRPGRAPGAGADPGRLGKMIARARHRRRRADHG